MNRQVYPPTISPLQGDILSTPNSPNVTVTGIQTTQVNATLPTTGQLLVAHGDGTAMWEDPAVSGVNAVETTPTKPPVQVGGQDECNLVRELRLDTYGSLRAVRMEELLTLLLAEMRAMKLAIISLDSTAVPDDFDATQFTENDPAEL